MNLVERIRENLNDEIVRAALDKVCQMLVVVATQVTGMFR